MIVVQEVPYGRVADEETGRIITEHRPAFVPVDGCGDGYGVFPTRDAAQAEADRLNA
jgi:hypothetical protein